MSFSTLFYYASVYFYNDSSEIPLSSFKVDSIDYPFKLGGKEEKHTEQHLGKRRSVPIQSCFSRLGTTKFSVDPLTVHFRHAQVFSYNLPNIETFSCQADLISIPNLPYPLDIYRSSACWKPPVPGVIFHLLTSLFEPLVPLKKKKKKKKKRVLDMVLSPYICWRMSNDCDEVFLQQDPKLSGLFVLQCSLPNDLKKRSCQQNVKKWNSCKKISYKKIRLSANHSFN